MSSKGRGAASRPADFYPTEREVAESIIQYLVVLGLGPGQDVLEPSAGSGSFLHAIHDVAGVTADANELHVDRYPELADAPTRDLIAGRFERVMTVGSWDWIIGNPPFTPAVEHIKHALFLLRPGGRVAFLLRSGFLSTGIRAEFRSRAPLEWELQLQERPSFTGDDQTDSSEYTVFIFRHGYTGPTFKHYFCWKKQNAAIGRRDLARFRQLVGVQAAIQEAMQPA